VLRKGPEEVGPGLAETGTRLITLIHAGPAFDTGHVRDWLAFRDDFNRQHSARQRDPVPVG
jgi:hypothetical protein